MITIIIIINIAITSIIIINVAIIIICNKLILRGRLSKKKY